METGDQEPEQALESLRTRDDIAPYQILNQDKPL